MADFYKYWGKAKKLEDGTYDYHLLVYHCLDVAAVGKVWLEKNLPFVKKASAAFGLSKNGFIELFLFFLSLHDLGKFRISFQNLCPEILKKLQGRENVDVEYSIRHDQLGYNLYNEVIFDWIYEKYFKEINPIPFKEYLSFIASSSFGHHGIPPTGSKPTNPPDATSKFISIIWNNFLSQSLFQNSSSFPEFGPLSISTIPGPID